MQSINERNKWLYPKWDVLCLLPGLLGFALWYLVPFASSMVRSFLSDDAAARFVGLQNYVSICQNSYYTLSLRNTTLFLVEAIVLCLVLGFVLSALLFRMERRDKASMPLVSMVLLIPIFLPTAAVVPLWKAMFGTNTWLVQHIQMKDSSWKYLMLMMIYVWKNVGAVNLLFLTGLNAIDRSVFDAARVDGAGKPRVMLKIALPILRPMTLFGIIYLAMNGLRIFRESYLLCGQYPPKNLYFIQNYVNNHFSKLDYSLLSAGSTLFALIVTVAFAIIWLLLGRKEGEAV